MQLVRHAEVGSAGRTSTDRPVEPVTPIDQQELPHELADKAGTEGVNLIGPGGLLTGLTKDVLETARSRRR